MEKQRSRKKEKREMSKFSFYSLQFSNLWQRNKYQNDYGFVFFSASDTHRTFQLLLIQ